MTLASGTRLGPYEVTALAGSGGMGEVYRARDLRLNRDVAIKILPPSVAADPTRRARFEREAQAVSRLSHPHICAIYDVGEHDGVAYLVMEFIAGESLEQRLRVSPLPLPEALETACQIASALVAAHERGIVHRDLKPANVMLAGSGVKLLDFGIAKLLDEDLGGAPGALAPTASLTADQKIIGTLNYMSPEQLEARPIDARTDIFAFGALLYEMVTGCRAFDGATSATVAAAVLTVDPPAVSARAAPVPVSPALDHVVRRALAKKADERWQTARDVMLELRWIMEGGARSAASTAAPIAWRRRALWPAIAAVAIAVAGGAVGWIIRPAAAAKSDGPLTILTLESPRGTKFDPGYGMVAVSPDGQKIAFATNTAGSKQLWIRYLNSPIAKQVLGPDGASDPFWSPDSNSVGYYGNGNDRIYRVDIRGGQPRLIVQLSASASAGITPAACWMADDTIVFTDRQALKRVSASGGTAVLLTAPDEATNERGFWFPNPIGAAHVVFAVRGVQVLTESRVVETSGRLAKALPTVFSNAVYAAGYLIFREGAAIVAQPFDDRSLQLRGRPAVLGSGVSYNPASGRTAFSASADVLAYRLDARTKLTWIDRSGRRVGSVGEAGRDWDPVVARDGSNRILVAHFDETTSGFQIWTIDAEGHAAAFTHGLKERAAIWSPDMQWVAYSMAALDGAEIHRMRTSGPSQDEVLLRNLPPGNNFPLDWTPDGRFLVYASAGDLWALPMEGERKSIQLTRTPTLEKLARVSADGRWLAFTVLAAGSSSIWIREFPNGTSRRVSAGDGTDPTWRQDGKELYFVTSEGRMMALPVISEAPLTFGSPTELFRITPGVSAALHVFAAAPDGQKFLVSEPVEADPSLTVIVHWPALVRQ